MARQAYPGILPVGRLEHLVRAATDPGAAADSWDRYVAAMGWDFPNLGEIRLFPLVRHQLGGSFPDAARQAWFTLAQDMVAGLPGQDDLARADRRLAELAEDAGLRLCRTKGAVLGRTVYPSADLRPVSDIDLICRWQDLPALARALSRAGAAQKFGPTALTLRERFAFNSVGWTLPGGIDVDVSWQPRLSFAFDPFLVETLFARSGDGPIFDADPTWLLIECADHGLLGNVVAPLRWVVDAIFLMDRQGDRIDWDLVREVARRYRLHAILGTALQHLAAFRPAVMPFAVDLMSRASRLERSELHARMSDANLLTSFRVGRRYARLLRAPRGIYRIDYPSPFGTEPNQSIEMRLGIAGRNIVTRLLGRVLPQGLP